MKSARLVSFMYNKNNIWSILNKLQMDFWFWFYFSKLSSNLQRKPSTTFIQNSFFQNCLQSSNSNHYILVFLILYSIQLQNISQPEISKISIKTLQNSIRCIFTFSISLLEGCKYSYLIKINKLFRTNFLSFQKQIKQDQKAWDFYLSDPNLIWTNFSLVF